MKINILYFSPTGSTQKVVERCMIMLKEAFDKSEVIINDITLRSNREENLNFYDDDIVVIGIPIYAGRVPNILLRYFDKISSESSKCLAIVTYGNRNFDDGLIELYDILASKGFNVLGAAAIPSEHSFSNKIATGRPDKYDFEKLDILTNVFIDKINHEDLMIKRVLEIEGCRPYRAYYQPKDEQGIAVDFKSIKPVTDALCINCGMCASNCPMGSIDNMDYTKVLGPCIKCCRCIKYCPTKAKNFTSIDFIRHKCELENELENRKESVFFS